MANAWSVRGVETRPDVELTRLGSEAPVPCSSISVSAVTSALSYALDLATGEEPGHSIRSCFLGMALARRLQLEHSAMESLYYALLLKDLGCSGNASRFASIYRRDELQVKSDLRELDWTRPHHVVRYIFQTTEEDHLPRRLFVAAGTLVRAARHSADAIDLRCHRGANITRKIGFAERVGEAIQHLDEHWNGRGKPRGLKGEAIPISSRILLLAQTVDVFLTKGGLGETREVIRSRRGRWFDPKLADAMLLLLDDPSLLETVRNAEVARKEVSRIAPSDKPLASSEDHLNRFADAFADVIDAKSPYTSRHSHGVAAAACGIAHQLAFNDLPLIRRAALLHDIGKLGIPNTILDKPGKLTGDEWAKVRQHPEHTFTILSRSDAFADIALIASLHHERLDGSGYPWGLAGSQLSAPSRMIAVADVYDALSSERPYRKALDWSEVKSIMSPDVGSKLDGPAFEALCRWVDGGREPVLPGSAVSACAL